MSSFPTIGTCGEGTAKPSSPKKKPRVSAGRSDFTLGTALLNVTRGVLPHGLRSGQGGAARSRLERSRRTPTGGARDNQGDDDGEREDEGETDDEGERDDDGEGDDD
jgi:hypothetical protein